MSRLILTMKPSVLSTRVLLHRGQQDILRAALPAPGLGDPRAAATFLEGLSLWFQQRLFAVLVADDQGHSSDLGLCDGFGFGHRTAYYEVEVVEPGRRRGLGSFRDLRQLALRGAP